MKKQILLILLITIVMLSSCGNSESDTSNNDSEQLDAFETVDLEGNDVTQEVFKENDITMINVWATWCPPCVAEMPYLAKLNEQLPENVGLIGICTDANDSPDDAIEILEANNATFTVLIPSDAMLAGFLSTVDAIPTTIFVDSNGNIVGSPQIGAPGSSEEVVIEGYLDLIDKALDEIN